MGKLISMELPDWANWLVQDEDGTVDYYEVEPEESKNWPFFNARGEKRFGRLYDPEEVTNPNWRDSKINLNTHCAHIDSNGVLHRCALAPDMLKEQA